MHDKSRNVVVIATYKEAETIDIILSTFMACNLPAIVVDDNSPDGTANLAKAHKNAYVIVRKNKRGIASAYLDGFHAALEQGYDYIVQMDAGLTHDPTKVPSMLDKCQREQFSLVIGSRFLNGLSVKSYRTLISLGAAWLMSRINVDVKDATGGFRCWHGAHLRKLLTEHSATAKGFAFQLELLYWTFAMGGKVGEIPIDYLLSNSSFNFNMVCEGLQVYKTLLTANRLSRRRT
ncbi:MAG: glycosyltransferase [Candidatus Parabeggiatoa sp.]|nr:glycosyltransferase [Candidatus Parabeggiatoa sp.]